jgi:hypothetical protein
LTHNLHKSSFTNTSKDQMTKAIFVDKNISTHIIYILMAIFSTSHVFIPSRSYYIRISNTAKLQFYTHYMGLLHPRFLDKFLTYLGNCHVSYTHWVGNPHSIYFPLHPMGTAEHKFTYSKIPLIQIIRYSESSRGTYTDRSSYK